MFTGFAEFVGRATMLAALAMAGPTLRAAEGGASAHVASELASASGRYDSRLVRKVLRVSGATAIDADRASRAFDAFADRLRAHNTVVGDARSRARAILEFAHAEILRGDYCVGGSDLAATLAGGPFNCATATAVFLALAGQFDLQSQAASVVGHVWCRVTSGEGSFDVETTCRDWFALAERAGSAGDKSQLWQQYLRRARGARLLDEPAFLAVFHFNRGVRLLREGQFGPAAAANCAAIELDPLCRPAYDNLWASLGQWSLALADLRKKAPGAGAP